MSIIWDQQLGKEIVGALGNVWSTKIQPCWNNNCRLCSLQIQKASLNEGQILNLVCSSNISKMTCFGYWNSVYLVKRCSFWVFRGSSIIASLLVVRTGNHIKFRSCSPLFLNSVALMMSMLFTLCDIKCPVHSKGSIWQHQEDGSRFCFSKWVKTPIFQVSMKFATHLPSLPILFRRYYTILAFTVCYLVGVPWQSAGSTGSVPSVEETCAGPTRKTSQDCCLFILLLMPNKQQLYSDICGGLCRMPQVSNQNTSGMFVKGSSWKTCPCQGFCRCSRVL